MSEQSAYFLTVDWCNKGNRGIFCTHDGKPFRKDEAHTEDEMQEILGVFWMIFKPQSILFSQSELAKFNKWRPLAEYSNQFGIALPK